MKKQDYLCTEIEHIKVSNEFLQMARMNGFRIVKDFTDSTVKELLQKPGMNYRMLAELNNILHANGILRLLKES